MTSHGLMSECELIENNFEFITVLESNEETTVYKAMIKNTQEIVVIKANKHLMVQQKENHAAYSLRNSIYTPKYYPPIVFRDNICSVSSYEGKRFMKSDGKNEKILSKMNLLLFVYHGVQALGDVHMTYGFLHMNVRPNNFIFRRTPGLARLLLTDFTFAESFNREHNVFPYAPYGMVDAVHCPPQVLREQAYTEACDIYCLMYFFVSLAGFNFDEMMNWVLSNDERANALEYRFQNFEREVVEENEWILPIVQALFAESQRGFLPVRYDRILQTIIELDPDVRLVQFQPDD